MQLVRPEPAVTDREIEIDRERQRCIKSIVLSLTPNIKVHKLVGEFDCLIVLFKLIK